MDISDAYVCVCQIESIFIQVYTKEEKKSIEKVLSFKQSLRTASLQRVSASYHFADVCFKFCLFCASLPLYGFQLL